jgi:tetraacyldisaccharide 4'-kinase
MSFLYRLGVGLRLAAMKKRRKKELPGFTLSVGNLTAGGTGKTPAAITIAGWARDEGYNVAVLSRGYRGSYNKRVFVVSDGHDIKAGPDQAGDEPFLMARRLNGVPVLVSKDRYLAGLIAHERFGTDFFILDDGFQHLILKRDLDIVLIDASNPFGNGHLLPWGPLREPVKQLQRADAVIFSRYGSGHSGDDTEKALKERLEEKVFFMADHRPEKVVFPFKDSAYGPEFLKGKRIAAFAGIARPDSFRETLISLGADLVSFKGFKDHYLFSVDEFRGLVAEKESRGAEYLMSTEKDWVRLEGLIPEYPDMAFLGVQFAFVSGREEFFDMVKERIKKRLISRDSENNRLQE